MPHMLDVNLDNAIVCGCRINGISAWNVNLAGAQQENLVITRDDEPTITVDNLPIAQFIYLLLNNKEIRPVIDTITSKSGADLRSFHTRRTEGCFRRYPTRVAKAELSVSVV